MTLLAALGPLTGRVRLGPLVLGATYRHPAVVANQVTALDHVSDGRAIAGLGAGWQVNEHAAYGIDLPGPAELSDRFEESVAVVCGAAARGADDVRRPLLPARRRSQPAAAGPGAGPGAGRRRRASRRTIPMAARYADVWHVWGTPESYAAKSARLTEACEAAGRDPGEVRRATGYPFDAGTDDAERLAPYRGGLRRVRGLRLVGPALCSRPSTTSAAAILS